MWPNSKYVHSILALLILLTMAATAVALWKGLISIEWLASFGYRGIFLVSLINSISPVAGPSQIATFLIASKLNPMLVGIAGGVGGAIGELTGYLFGYSMRSSLSRQAEQKFERVKNWRFIRFSHERSFVPLFILASIPNPFFDPISALAGSLRIAFPKYFVPVLLGRTLRHVVIAYAGFYSISLYPGFLGNQTGLTMALIVDSLPFIGVVILIAVAAWIVRTFAESDPDPLILNLTFFSVAAQGILTPDLAKVISPEWVLVLSLIALVLVFLQVLTIRDHADVTMEHYKTILRENKINKTNDSKDDADIEHWAAALVRITGRDFSPEVQSLSSQGFESGSRSKRRREALAVIPRNLFNVGKDGITSTTLRIPEKLRQWRWWAYVLICLASWIVFLICILIVRRHK